MAQRAILATEELGLAIGGARILDDVSLRVRDGEFLAVIGPNGAGKTSLFNLLSGLYRPTTGRIEFDGKDVTSQPPFRRARSGLIRSFQVTSVFGMLSVLDNVLVAARAHLGGSWKVWRRAAGDRDAIERARLVLAEVGLHADADVAAASLSHGDKRKLEIAIALAGEPRVLLLDEPTAGMGVEDVPAVMSVVRDIQRRGTTVVMVEHRMDVVVELADRMAVMHHGALLACDTPEAVMANETVQSAYLGESL
ncbi:MAG: ABC transporter ATP-binding protein [Actinomycetia bacterium]|nr:ABC transporter ATP-binding protein [Actinomycetes bacterium]